MISIVTNPPNSPGMVFRRVRKTTLPSEVSIQWSPPAVSLEEISPPQETYTSPLGFSTGWKTCRKVVVISISCATDLPLAVGKGQRNAPRCLVKVAQLRSWLKEEPKSCLSPPGIPWSNVLCTGLHRSLGVTRQKP